MINIKEEVAQFFKEKGFARKRCKKCGSWFWTLSAEQEICGDQPCADFSFIGNPLTKKEYSPGEMRRSFLSFFEKRGHEVLKPYPVVARWRKDIYLTIASIADFQPHVTSGKVPPPANPLVISQPSIRLNDLEQVGVSGKHLTIFEMMGHHAFNYKENYIYWTEETAKYCHEFLSRELGIGEDKITYKESIWEGGGNAGPCLEVLSGGLEIATLVFMNLEEDRKGRIILEGKRYSPMEVKVVDTGYGLERLVWLSKGSKTVYDAIYPSIIKSIKEESQVKEDVVAYALADHTKCILFMLGDGIVPSNVKAGYLARLMIRRTLRFIRILEMDEDFIFKLIDRHLQLISKDFPHLVERKDNVEEMIKVEMEKYRETITKGEKLVEKILREKRKIEEKELVKLYDSHGIHPEMIKRIAAKKGIEISIPSNFDSMVAELHSYEKEKEKEEISLPDLPKTRKLYYESSYAREFDAKVIWYGKLKNRHSIVLDKTAFYPEGGGQPSDRGYLVWDGKKIKVEGVENMADRIVHYVDQGIDEGAKVRGTIDWNRRLSLMRHHTATHLINGVCRLIFGEHVWQAGSKLEEHEARFDFTHYKALALKDIEKIEEVAKDFIRKNIEVRKRFMERNDAEKLYGVRLFQGGVPEGREIRVVSIPGLDVEACGGTHLDSTAEIEEIRILKAERIQDGINRLVFVAGRENVRRVEEKERKLLKDILDALTKKFDIRIKEEKDVRRALYNLSTLFSVPQDKIIKTIKKFLKDLSPGKVEARNIEDACKKLFALWKKTQKDKKRIPAELVKEIKEKSKVERGIKLITVRPEELRTYDAMALAGEIIKEKRCIALISDGKSITMAASPDVRIDLRPIAVEIGKLLGGGGGGREKMVRCGGNRIDKMDEAIEMARKMILERIGKNEKG